MTIKTLRGLALLACAAGANAWAGPAPSSISVDMDFRYELIDLAPGDGIAPSISFYDRAAEVYLVNWSRGATSDETRDYLDHYGTATRRIGPNFSTVIGSATGAGIEFDLFDRSSYAAARNRLAFTLSPNTRAVFTADYDISMWIDPSAQNPNAAIQFAGWLANPDQALGSLHGLVMQNGTGSSAGSLSVMADSGAAGAPGELELHTTAQVWTVAAPVPEPGQAGMLLAGALLLGAGLRRRRLSGPLPSSCRRPSRPAAAH